jgi:Transmembrane protein 254
MEIEERDWLSAGLMWVVLGAVGTLPPIAGTWFGWLGGLAFNVVLAIHILEAFYSLNLAERSGLDRKQWFYRTLLLGYFSLRRLRAAQSSSTT